ncbi:MAG: hypothetical protein EHM35_00290 [Planctomycetaceae bacterium]|nr:MAG: hypothetical protein EHM35_00290 [Planctomycetaceae bacterium]
MKQAQARIDIDAVYLNRGEYVTVYVTTSEAGKDREGHSMEIRVTQDGTLEIYSSAAEPPEITGFDRWYSCE